jgi:soluble lytic murein transglycosylase-like protein
MAISDEAMGAARYLTQLQKQFGSRRAALAAYEAGPGTVAAQIKAHPHTWLNQAGPAERKETTAAGPGLPDSVNRLIKAIRNRAPVKPAQVHITNSTAARVSVSVNAVGL